MILTATALVFLAGGSYLARSTWGFPNKDNEGDESPHRVGLIDLRYVLENYDKVKQLNDELQEKAQQKQAEFNESAKRVRAEQAELKEFAEGSEEYQKRDRKIAQMVAQLESQQKLVKRELQQESVKNAHTVYLEIQDVIERFCDHFKFTVVLQINRGPANDPNKVMQQLNAPVVWHRKQDDLSEGVLKFLNDKYAKAQGANGNQAKVPGGTKKPIEQVGGESDKPARSSGKKGASQPAGKAKAE